MFNCFNFLHFQLNKIFLDIALLSVMFCLLKWPFFKSSQNKTKDDNNLLLLFSSACWISKHQLLKSKKTKSQSCCLSLAVAAARSYFLLWTRQWVSRISFEDLLLFKMVFLERQFFFKDNFFHVVVDITAINFETLPSSFFSLSFSFLSR